MASKYLIDVTSPKKDFFDYISLIGNERVIFSGVFGSGKTYFLNDFFKGTYQESFISFHLYPTNYSVSKNEDIFELIKYDLLYQILCQQPQLEKFAPRLVDSLSLIGVTDSYKILAPFISYIPKIGKTVDKIITGLVEFKKLLDEKESQVTLDEGKLIKEYIERFETTSGSIFENDVYSKLINTLVCRLKESGKKVVLIVDDLDRIDPDHIFRILNVFAVHFNAYDLNENENKFGIDKVILCCDIDNIRSIFRNRYGADVDFNGYIDKFYSRGIYYFDNTIEVRKQIDGLLRSLKYDSHFLQIIPWADSRTSYFEIIKYIITSMVLSGSLNLRVLLKINKMTYNPPTYEIQFRKLKIVNWQVPMICLIDFLKDVFGSSRALLAALDKTNFLSLGSTNLGLERLNYKIFGELILLLENETHRFAPDKDFTTRCFSENSAFHYHIKYNMNATLEIFYIVLGNMKGDSNPITDSKVISLFTPENFKEKFIQVVHEHGDFKKLTIDRL